MLTARKEDDALARLLEGRPVWSAVWGLERIEALLEELGHPEQSFEAFHIAGTNGKGSTAAFAASVLRQRVTGVGLYTSPHLNDVRERFTLDGDKVDEALVQTAADRVLSCRTVGAATYFEAVTALAFLCFAESGARVAVVETGLGGRLDATNVLHPAGTAITPIGLEHTEVLGCTLREIAAEKAGIIEPDVPVSLGRIRQGARRVIGRRARELGAPLAELGVDAEVEHVEVTGSGTRFRYRSPTRSSGIELSTALPGAHQADNAALALLMLERSPHAPLPEEAALGVAAARVPGRFEVLPEDSRIWVLDVAHNPAGIEALRDTWERVAPPRPWVAIVGVLGDKDWGSMLDMLVLAADAIILTQPRSAPAPRRWDTGAARRRLAGAGLDVRVIEDVLDAIETGRELSTSGTVLVTGSAYTVGDVREAIGIAPPA